MRKGGEFCFKRSLYNVSVLLGNISQGHLKSSYFCCTHPPGVCVPTKEAWGRHMAIVFPHPWHCCDTKIVSFIQKVESIKDLLKKRDPPSFQESRSNNPREYLNPSCGENAFSVLSNRSRERSCCFIFSSPSTLQLFIKPKFRFKNHQNLNFVFFQPLYLYLPPLSSLIHICGMGTGERGVMCGRS